MRDKVIALFLLIISLNVNAYDVLYKKGDSLSLNLSYVQPNYISVDGDIITSVTAIGNSLLSESTTNGGIVVVLNDPNDFTFMIQTKNGLVIPIQYIQTEEAQSSAAYINIIPDMIKKAKKPKKWEKGNSYENELVNIALTMINKPQSFTFQKATQNTSHKFKLDGLKIKPELVAVGHTVYIVKYNIKNTSKEMRTLSENMFKVDKLKAIFFDQANLILNKDETINMYQIIATE